MKEDVFKPVTLYLFFSSCAVSLMEASLRQMEMGRRRIEREEAGNWALESLEEVSLILQFEEQRIVRNQKVYILVDIQSVVYYHLEDLVGL